MKSIVSAAQDNAEQERADREPLQENLVKAEVIV